MTLSESMNKQVEILYIEDVPQDADLMREAFEEVGDQHCLYIVRDGAEALTFLRQEAEFQNAPRPSLILMDLNLPRVDGHTALRTIKNDDRLKSIPVIVFTNSQTEADVRKSYEACANSFITKPGTYPEFVSVVRSLLVFWSGVAELPVED